MIHKIIGDSRTLWSDFFQINLNLYKYRSKQSKYIYYQIFVKWIITDQNGLFESSLGGPPHIGDDFHLPGRLAC